MAIPTKAFDVVVAGCGIAGLSAAVSAAQGGARVAVLERAPIEERGGNTRYTDAYLRMKSETEVTDDFESHFAENGGGYLDPELLKHATQPYEQWPSIVKTLSFADPELIAAFANACGPTVQWLKTFGVKFDFLPTQFLTKSQPRLLPIGGGLALVEALAAAAENLGVKFFYETTAVSLLQDENLAVTGLRALDKHGKPLHFAGKVILGCGGFEGNAEMQTRYIGPRALNLRPVARGGYYNKGEGIQMALNIGAASCGDFGSYHAEPIDPRSGRPEPSVFIFPYGILVNQEGLRFTDEAPGTVDATYESITRKIFNQTNGIAYAILDQKIHDVPNYKLGLRSDQPPIAGATLAELAGKLKVPANSLEQTVRDYNAACVPGVFKPLEVDWLDTRNLQPPKSNWARALDKPPYWAWPIISSNVLTFGGLKVNTRAQVLNLDGVPIPGLYAAGEVVGLYYKTYTGATSVLKGAVFGRLAGMDAASKKGGISKSQVLNIEKVKHDRAAFESALQFKNFVTIRRDLRDANAICDYVIKLNERILANPGELRTAANTIFLVRGALMQAVILYARWFKSTTGKPTLKPDTFFERDSKEIQAHEKIISLRDQYIAHKEIDILGGDRVWANFDSDGAFKSTESDWLEQQFINIDDLDMKQFQKCIHDVHNHIDSVILPDKQQKLNANLGRLFPGKPPSA